MVVGCLGSIVFQVSESTVRTLDNLAWSGSARYATHERHLMGALTEFTGMDPERVTFDITLCAELGSTRSRRQKRSRPWRTGGRWSP